MWEHVKILAEHQNEKSVARFIRKRPFDELLDLLGASAWESFSFAYLILEEDFLPTGLSIGRTLPMADIVGRRKSNGSRIVAQCKKGHHPVSIESDFRELATSLGFGGTAYFFAYGGCYGDVPSNIRVIDRTSALRWAQSGKGKLYRELLLGD
jgi:hypothetical protein